MSNVGGSRHDGCADVDLARRIEVQGRRSLALLRAIEDTISALDLDRTHFAAIGREMDNLTDLVMRCPVSHELDPEGKSAELFDQGLEALKSLRRRYAARLVAAESDHALCDDDGIADAYRNAIEATESTFDATQRATDAVREHDAEASGYSGDFATASELLAALSR